MKKVAFLACLVPMGGFAFAPIAASHTHYPSSSTTAREMGFLDDVKAMFSDEAQQEREEQQRKEREEMMAAQQEILARRRNPDMMDEYNSQVSERRNKYKEEQAKPKVVQKDDETIKSNTEYVDQGYVPEESGNFFDKVCA